MTVLTPAQATKRFPDEWVVLEVLEETPDGEVKRGRLLAHTKVRDKAYDAMMGPHEDVAIFYTGEIPKPGTAFAF